MRRVLVTGATGFVGRTLCETLSKSGYLVRASLHLDRSTPDWISEKVLVGDIGAATDWREALQGVSLVVHLAARAHILRDSAAASYVETNAEGTRRLADESARAGVKRFLYLSSVKVNGEATVDGAYTSSDEPHPLDDYGKSKWSAEMHVRRIAVSSAMDAVIVRPPLVYGPGVRANFLRLMRMVDSGWPLPLGAIDNRRSLISVWNLCDFLKRALEHPIASNRTWMVSDGEDLSTPDIIRRLGRAMGKRVRLIPVPVSVLKLIGAATGKKAELDRLCGSLVVDMAQSCRDLEWRPTLSVDEGLARTVLWYRSTR
jgi:UDP-glucose 4-epimerase